MLLETLKNLPFNERTPSTPEDEVPDMITRYHNDRSDNLVRIIRGDDNTGRYNVIVQHRGGLRPQRERYWVFEQTGTIMPMSATKDLPGTLTPSPTEVTEGDIASKLMGLIERGNPVRPSQLSRIRQGLAAAAGRKAA